jgi:hypothetical protein
VRSYRLARRPGAVLMTCALVACGDPSEPQQRVPAAVEVVAGDAQAPAAGAAAAVPPVVRVIDEDSLPVAGVTVTFTVVEGGGAVQRASARTDAQGEASPGTWTLGPTPGPNRLQASLNGGAGTTFTAFGCSSPDTSAYSITLCYVGSGTPAQRAAVDAAVERWSSVIVGELVNIPMDVSAGDCPALNHIVDDLLIFIELTEIDGLDKILGQSGPCWVRDPSRLPVVGLLQLDIVDLDDVQERGLMEDLILHEIGHVIGFGTLWGPRDKDLLIGSGRDPRYTGAAGVAAYRAAGGIAPTVPVEDVGGEGTIDSHWRETVFGKELMTGTLDFGTNPFSAVTMRSLEDLGYSVSAASADPYTLPSGVAAQSIAGASMPLEGRVRMIRPIGTVGPDGQRRPLR